MGIPPIILAIHAWLLKQKPTINIEISLRTYVCIDGQRIYIAENIFDDGLIDVWEKWARYGQNAVSLDYRDPKFFDELKHTLSNMGIE